MLRADDTRNADEHSTQRATVMSGQLLAMLRAAKRPSRVLDFEIHLALVGDPLWPAHDMRGRVTNPNAKMSDYLAGFRDVIDGDDQDFDFPRYTASVDAALTLLPAGKYWMVGFGRRAEPEPLGAAVVFEPGGTFDDPIAQSEGETVPLAICAAAVATAPWCAFCKKHHAGGDTCMGHHP